MASVLAHRLRSLLASIEGFADLLGGTLGDPIQRELVLRIIEGTARIEDVLADLSVYGRPVLPVLVPLRAEELIEGLLNLLSKAERRRVRVSRREVEVGVYADPVLVRQALLALIQKALEVEPEASVQLRARARGTVAVFEVWNRGEIRLTNAEEAVFQPFFTTKAQNLGLGLPIARRIAEAHGGTLKLARTSAKAGTRFELRLPAAPVSSLPASGSEPFCGRRRVHAQIANRSAVFNHHL